MIYFDPDLNAFIAECDLCAYGDDYDGDTHMFDDVVSEIKKAGWKLNKNTRGWRHTCPVCVSEGKKRS